MPDLFEGLLFALHSALSLNPHKGGARVTWKYTTALFERCKTLMTATRFVQVRTFRQWLLPVFKKSVATMYGYRFLLPCILN